MGRQLLRSRSLLTLLIAASLVGLAAIVFPTTYGLFYRPLVAAWQPSVVASSATVVEALLGLGAMVAAARLARHRRIALSLVLLGSWLLVPAVDAVAFWGGPVHGSIAVALLSSVLGPAWLYASTYAVAVVAIPGLLAAAVTASSGSWTAGRSALETFLPGRLPRRPIVVVSTAVLGSLFLLPVLSVTFQPRVNAPAQPLDWPTRDSGTHQLLRSIAYGNGSFVAVGDGVVLSSPDGLVWTDRSPALGDGSFLHSVIFAQDHFVAVGRQRSIVASSDGARWTRHDAPVPTTGRCCAVLHGIAYGDGRFVAVGEDEEGHGEILISPDGRGWARNFSGGERLESTAYGDGRFVAAGAYGAVVTSRDGVHWTQTRISALDGRLGPPGESYTLRGITYVNKKFLVAAGALTDNMVQPLPRGSIYWSSDGVRWNQVTIVPDTLTRILSATGQLIAVGDRMVLASTDGIHWSGLGRLDPRQSLLDASEGGGRIVAVGASGVIRVRH